MVFTNDREKNCAFDDLVIGDYFCFGNSFYIKTDVDDEDCDNYAVDLETGQGITIPSDAKVIQIDIKEIIYENM